jgi:hypothetical protein
VLRYGHLDTLNPRIDAEVIVWQIPMVPFGLAVTGVLRRQLWSMSPIWQRLGRLGPL